ncbi:hypothetical protein PybrP1_006371 [[Pythium] brassicae (nom. inval.)]|nr:hypothetical protein PybrP1_006371 [[Pythium] brassicae (nom. inval.)]
MATEWHRIIGVTHAPMGLARRDRLFDEHIRILGNRMVTQDWNEPLMVTITEGEVNAAIWSMARYMAPGLDQLPMDFFADCRRELAPWLAPQFDAILKGGAMLRTFKEGLIILLRKNRDSDNALDYRPITLLQSCCHVFAKMLTIRVQLGLQTLVRDTQQGFVKSRLLERSVTLMQAVLHERYNDTSEHADEAAAVILLDFMKEYDTLDRKFLLVLRNFGFAVDLVALIERRHDDTTARFAVNGELSTEVMIRSGIR